MPIQLTAEDAKQSLAAHVAAKGAEIYQMYGPTIGWKELLRILEDRTCIRYPCEILFDPGPLQSGECALAVPKGERPEDGFCLHVHPFCMSQLHFVPHLAFYQLVLVNYGEFASSDDAEIFGAASLGISQEEYYDVLCSLHDAVSGSSATCAGCA
jgi:hypothetical protein